jgi:hypothetical protein
VKWSSVEQLSAVQTAFEKKTRFPGVIGCIDATHITIRGPFNNRDDYINRNCHSTFQLQEVCDSQLMLTNIYTANSGSVHDARMYMTCELKTHLETNPLPEQYHLLMEFAYPECGLNCPIQKELPPSR